MATRSSSCRHVRDNAISIENNSNCVTLGTSRILIGSWRVWISHNVHGSTVAEGGYKSENSNC